MLGLFIKGAALVHKALPDVSFWIVGDGYLWPDLERLSSTLRLTPASHSWSAGTM
jgi:glycosyltransferase involved in cell wall biosynthesis